MSTEEYTPTDEVVRDTYVRTQRNAFVASTSEHEMEFDRWRAGVERAARAEAWDEAIAAVFAWWAAPKDRRPSAVINPYGVNPFADGGDGE